MSGTPLMPMSIINECSYPGCDTLTVGTLCLAHDWPVTRTFVRGRPYIPQRTLPVTAAEDFAALGSQPAMVQTLLGERS